MRTQFGMVAVVIFWVALSSVASGVRALPDKKIVQAEAAQIKKMAAAGDVDGLVGMLSKGLFVSKVKAAEHIAEIGDSRALPALKQLNENHGGWVAREVHHYRSGAFAMAICKILSRDLPQEEQIQRLFDLLEGRGPCVPVFDLLEGREPCVPKSTPFGTPTVDGKNVQVRKRLLRIRLNHDVGKRVAAQLDKFEDPAIVKRLRKSENRGAAIPAVWMEVRDMPAEEAIQRCAEIARTEGRPQCYGAIHCLEKFGIAAVDQLDALAADGYRDAIDVLGNWKNDPRVFDRLCWHLLNNKNSSVRTAAVHHVSIAEDTHRLMSLRTLTRALYDPCPFARRRAASAIWSRAVVTKIQSRSAARGKPSKSYTINKHCLDQVKDDWLIAANHPDPEVRATILKALQRLGWDSNKESLPHPPPMRTDLEAKSLPPWAGRRPN